MANEELDLLYRQNVGEMRNYLKNRLPEWAVDDVIQDAFVRALQYWDSFKPQPSKKGKHQLATRLSWLYVILRNCTGTWLRREFLRSPAFNSKHKHGSTSIEDLADRHLEPSYDGLQNRVALQDAFERAGKQVGKKTALTAQLRLAMSTNREVGEVLHVPERTIGSRKRRFALALRYQLEAK